MKLIALGSDSKTVKGEKLGYYTGIQYLAPSTMSGVSNTCPHASAGCRAACLFTSGRAGIYRHINEARINKTKMFFNDTDNYFTLLVKNINSLITKSKKDGMIPAVRLNGTSDILWEAYNRVNGKNIFDTFPTIQFYDYTKDFLRMMRFTSGKLPANYHLTFSRSESNQAQCEQVLASGGNVAVVFQKEFPATYLGYKVVAGDDTDLRFGDEKNVVVGLKAKGKARKDSSGFVVIP